MDYTVVYINDDGYPYCYGRFSSKEVAQKFADRINAELDDSRDPAGGGAGDAYACAIHRKRDWADA